MPIASFLRFCLCSLLIICFAIDTSAQRTGRSRSVEVDTAQKTVVKKDYVLRCEKRTIPGELFSRADLVRSQKELETIDINTAAVQTKKNCWFIMDTVKIDEVESTVTREPETEEDRNALPYDCKETNAINQPNVADAYPYLSSDGLRIYFTSSRNVAFSRLYISTRKSINDPFGEPEILSPALTEGFYGATLTADELTICMVRSGDMYISIRNSIDEKFPAPVLVTGASNGTYYGPSISADGKEIIVNADKGVKEVTRLYKRTGKYNVAFHHELPVPEGVDPGPGQFSKDGLSYYLSIKTPEYSNERSSAHYHLWLYSRASLDDNFSSFPEELSEQMEGLNNILQPSLNGDGSILAFVTSPTNTWQDDDILLVSLPKPGEPVITCILEEDIPPFDTVSIPFSEKLDCLFKDYVCGGNFITIDVPLAGLSMINDYVKKPSPVPAIFAAKVYPNPFTSSVIIDVDQLPENGALLDLYDISGKKIRQEQISNRRTTISLDRLTPGIYSYRLMNKKGELLSSGKLVKAE